MPRRDFSFTLVALLALGAPVGSAPAPEGPRASAELLKARVETARKAYDRAVQMLKGGQATDPEQVYRWSCRLLHAEQAAASDPAGRRAAAEAHRRRMVDLRDRITILVKEGRLPPADAAGADYYVAEADVWLDEAKKP